MDAIAPVADVTIVSLFMQANWVVKVVMIGLLLASLWSWAVIFDKLIAFSNTRRSIKRFEQIFWSGQSLDDLYSNLGERRVNGMTSVFMVAMREWKKSLEKGAQSTFGLQMRIDKAMDVALSRETDKLEARLGFLATVGSAAPFIGLFGTVIGIMTSFQAIAQSQNTSLAIVAPGIAEALLATAIGLLAAIPAVIAYNKLSADASRIGAQLEGFADEFSGILSRQIDERSNAPRLAPPQQNTQQPTQQHAAQQHAAQQHAAQQHAAQQHAAQQHAAQQHAAQQHAAQQHAAQQHAAQQHAAQQQPNDMPQAHVQQPAPTQQYSQPQPNNVLQENAPQQHTQHINAEGQVPESILTNTDFNKK